MQLKYRSYQRAGGVFYWQENGTSARGSVRTKDRAEAGRLLAAMNEAHRQPTLNLALGRAYLSAHDPRLCTCTWQAVMDEMARHGKPGTQMRCARAMRSHAYDPIRHKPLVTTTADDFPAICHTHGNSVGHYSRRFHNLALNLGWLAWPILHKAVWPKIRSESKRAITLEEHAAIIASEKNPERRAYYELLYETGAAQTDAANLTAAQIEIRRYWQRRERVGEYRLQHDRLDSTVLPMHLIWTLMIGLVVGIIAKILTPGRDPGGCLITSLIGIAGAFIATFLGQFLHFYAPDQTAGFIGSVIGAIILLVIYHAFRSKPD